MKIALIRVLAIATLATSMAAFAATDETKRDDAATSVAKKQDGCPESGNGKKQKKAKASQSDDQKEKELDRLLMGMYG